MCKSFSRKAANGLLVTQAVQKMLWRLIPATDISGCVGMQASSNQGVGIKSTAAGNAVIIQLLISEHGI
jgi:hypothetical protein